jgi:hypothetical protein
MITVQIATGTRLVLPLLACESNGTFALHLCRSHKSDMRLDAAKYVDLLLCHGLFEQNFRFVRIHTVMHRHYRGCPAVTR